MSFMTEITKMLNRISDTCEKHNPDSKHNTGKLVGQAFFWTKVEAYAKGKKDEAWDLLTKEGLCDVEECKSYDPGEYSLLETPSFSVTAKVTNPVKRFDDNVLAMSLFKSKYKVPAPVTKELVNAAKVPTKPQVSKTVVER